jgi:hypothetical protein
MEAIARERQAAIPGGDREDVRIGSRIERRRSRTGSSRHHKAKGQPATYRLQHGDAVR